MKVLIVKTKNGKIKYKYKSEDGLIFEYENHCKFYEQKWMKKVKNDKL